MKIALFSAKAYDRDYFEQANQQFDYELDYFDVRLDQKTSRLAHGYPVVCAFVNDDLSRPVLTDLVNNGTSSVSNALRRLQQRRSGRSQRAGTDCSPRSLPTRQKPLRNIVWA